MKRSRESEITYQEFQSNMKRRNFLRSHQAQVYRTSRFENPYFSGKKNSIKMSKYFILPLCIFIFVIVCWGFISIPLMHIKTIKINGLITISPSAVEQTVQFELNKSIFKFLPGDHIWLYNSNAINEILENQYQLTNISIQRNGRELQIDANERITRIVWISNNEMSFLDQNGAVVRQLSELERTEVEKQINSQNINNSILQRNVIAIWDISNQPPAAQGQLLSNDTIITIDTFDALLFNSTVKPISYLINEANEKWVIAKTTLGVDIYLDGEGDAQNQFNNLQIILEEYKDQINTLDYIDLRFGNRVFLK